MKRVIALMFLGMVALGAGASLSGCVVDEGRPYHRSYYGDRYNHPYYGESYHHPYYR